MHHAEKTEGNGETEWFYGTENKIIWQIFVSIFSYQIWRPDSYVQDVITAVTSR
jgi:hypothetical protein